jgi:electron transfer flavoprotein-quinone oxidoreductase
MGLYGMGFLYTNRDSISIGIGVMISELVKAKKNGNELLEHLKSHPSIRPLIEGGETVEYTAHMIPEGGYTSMPRLYADGVLVVGDAAMMVNAIHGEGSNLALISGKLAGEAVIEARAKGDFSAAALSGYQRRLENSFIMKDLKKYANLNGFMFRNLHFFDYYPKVANEALRELFTVDSVPKKAKQRRLIEIATQERSRWQIAKDLFGLWRSAW